MTVVVPMFQRIAHSMLPCVCSVSDRRWRQKCGWNKKVALKAVSECVTNVPATFWDHLWSIAEQTHCSMLLLMTLSIPLSCNWSWARTNKNARIMRLIKRHVLRQTVNARLLLTPVADPDLELGGSPFCFACPAGFSYFCDFFFSYPSPRSATGLCLLLLELSINPSKKEAAYMSYFKLLTWCTSANGSRQIISFFFLNFDTSWDVFQSNHACTGSVDYF